MSPLLEGGKQVEIKTQVKTQDTSKKIQVPFTLLFLCSIVLYLKNSVMDWTMISRYNGVILQLLNLLVYYQYFYYFALVIPYALYLKIYKKIKLLLFEIGHIDLNIYLIFFFERFCFY
jgi:hypothetical protein